MFGIEQWRGTSVKIWLISFSIRAKRGWPVLWGRALLVTRPPFPDRSPSGRALGCSLPGFFHHLLHCVRRAADEFRVTAVHYRDRCCTHLQRRDREASRAAAQRSRSQHRRAFHERDILPIKFQFTVCTSTGDVLPLMSAFPSYTAVML